MATFTKKLSTMFNEGFDFGLTSTDYPIFDETYRAGLNLKILKHYWNYEIGQETDSMFRFALNRKMNEIMPYWNQIYLSTKIQFDPLQTVNVTDVVDGTAHDTRSKEQTGNATSGTNSQGRVVGSETPQVLLSPNEDYASSAQNTVSGVTATSSQTGNDSETGDATSSNTRTTTGSTGIAAEILMAYRAALLNVDMMVIEQLGTLFMQIWDNGDEYSHSDDYMYGIGFGYVPYL